MKILFKDDIKKIIPHREPMLLVDEIRIHEDKRVVGVYHFTGDEWFFQGHFPSKPIVPGVILCEIMAQVSCGLLIDRVKGKIPYLISINNAKFRKMVLPNDVIEVECNITKTKEPFYFVKCKLYDNNFLSANSEITFYISNEKN